MHRPGSTGSNVRQAARRITKKQEGAFAKFTNTVTEYFSNFSFSKMLEGKLKNFMSDGKIMSGLKKVS